MFEQNQSKVFILTVTTTDIALIQNNALVGSRIAVELTKLREIKAFGKPQTVRLLMVHWNWRRNCFKSISLM